MNLSNERIVALIVFLLCWQSSLSSGTVAWNSWGAWTSCTQTCGEHGVRNRQRTCPDSGKCSGKSVQMVPCNSHGCPRDGGWSQWTPWATCCRGESTTRHRICSDPLPAYGGQDCTGQSLQAKTCETFCPRKHKLSCVTLNIIVIS